MNEPTTEAGKRLASARIVAYNDVLQRIDQRLG